MKSRRDFIRSAAVLSALGAAGLPLRAAENKTESAALGDDRRYWVFVTEKIARPVLENLARRQLRKNMPVEAHPQATKREIVTHLEAFGRLLCGIAPWLELENLTGNERKSQQELLRLAQSALDAATDPASPDFLNFTAENQPLVDTAFLAQGILRAPKVLWEPLELRVKNQIVAALKSSRKIGRPHGSNWVMFAATVEAALLEFGESTIEDRLENCVRDMMGWYVGDGAYGDGVFLHFDYYNSFVIHPMLLDVLTILKKHDGSFAAAHAVELKRARRFAEIQERLISPEGTFPSIGRSTAYRFGAFQSLAQISLLRELPDHTQPAQVRCALTAVIRKMVEVPGTFDANGWLQIGFCGHQPALGETYISTGSLYLCAVGLLPLGLPPTDDFWNAASAKWTSQKLWSGENLPADHAISDTRKVEVPTLKR